MQLNKLEQLARQLELMDSHPDNRPAILERAPAINEAVQQVLTALEQQNEHYRQQLSARMQLQAAMPATDGMPEAAKEMLAADQLAFYRRLVGDMLAFFSGSRQGRCVSFDLTVEELLFFIRLLLEEKVMDVSSLKVIFMFLSKHGSTAHSDRLSYESLRKKYSGIGSHAKQTIQKLIERMAKRAAGNGA